MEDTVIQTLEQQLRDKIASLDKQRAAQTAAFEKEQEDRRIIEAAEREERVKAIKQAEERRAVKEKAAAEAEAKRQQEARESQIKAEQLLNEQQEIVRKQQEKLEWLEKAISDAEFVEEQQRKVLDDAKSKGCNHPLEETEEEHDNAHILTGEAAAGTDGLEVGPSMSAHLRSILRRANSEIN